MFLITIYQTTVENKMKPYFHDKFFTLPILARPSCMRPIILTVMLIHPLKDDLGPGKTMLGYIPVLEFISSQSKKKKNDIRP